jgi:hypothetical protein
LRRSTLAAAALLALLAGYIYWFEREPVSEDEGEKVFGVEEDSIERIEIRRAGDTEPVVVEREESRWRLVSPVEARADGEEVGLLLQNLATMRFDRVVAQASSVKLSDFGLDPVKLEVRFRTEEGAERSLSFGSDTPTPSKQYARRDGGEDILVVAEHLSLNFDKSGWDLREKGVFASLDGGGAPEPSRIEIERPQGKLVLSKEGSLWFVSEPRSRADRSRAAGIASRVRGAEMKEVASEIQGELAAFGLDAPSRRVRIELESGEPLQLEIGQAKDSDFYARTPAREQIFVLGSELVSELDVPLEEIQSKKLFDYSTFAAKKVVIEEKGTATRTLERQDSTEDKKWRQIQPEPARDVDTTEVEDLLYALNGASGTLGAASKEEPDLRITVTSGDPAIEETVSVRKRADGVEVERAGETVAVKLSLDAWKDVESKLKLDPEAEPPNP